MQVIFLADRTCALTVNGCHVGLVDGFERKLHLNPEDNVACVLYPFGGELPLSFLFCEQFLQSPPPNVHLYHTKNAVAIYAFDFLPADQSMKVLWQKRLNTTLLTLVLQGKLQLNLENGQGFHLISLPLCLQNAQPQEYEGSILLYTPTHFALISQEGELLLCREGEVESFSSTLTASIPFHDSLGHTALCQWEGKTLLSCSITCKKEPTSATVALALFESALIGADTSPYLSPSLQEKASSLKEYLGDFRSVVLTENEKEVGLVYERCPRVFDVRYFQVDVEEGKISNLRPT